MRRRVVERPAKSTDDAEVPAELLLGACIELWAPASLRPDGLTDAGWFGYDTAPGWAWCMAFRRYSDAFTAFVKTLGVEDGNRPNALPAKVRHIRRGPWSFARLERENPELLAEKLARAGLPATWRPL